MNDQNRNQGFPFEEEPISPLLPPPDNKMRYSDLEAYSFLISHEMKTPIREIDLYAEFIEEDNADTLTEQGLQDLHSIRRICATMVDLFQNIMDYARADYKPLNLEVIDMYALIQKTYQQRMATISDRDIVLDMAPLPKLWGDAFLFQQMVSNILSNSIKYTAHEPHPLIRVSAYEEKGEIVYRFQDNGVGIDSKGSAYAFHLFERLHNADEFEGSGVGLALVKRIVTRFGGDVEIAGQYQQGCTVKVSFPIKYAIQPEEAEPETFEEIKTIKIGVIGDFSGPYAFLEVNKKAAYELAVAEINQAGGIDGRTVSLLFRDDKSDIILSEEHARALVEIEQVDVIMGGLLSPNREAIRNVVNQTKTLYFYNEHYEGGVADHYTFCTSQTPEHTIYPEAKYLMDHFGKRFYLVVADYIWGILIAEGIKAFIKKEAGEIIAVEYIPVSKTNFRITIENILECKPDVLVYLGVGQNHNHFHAQWSQLGRKDIPVMSPNCINECYLHKSYPAPVMRNTYFMTSYIEELESDAAVTFRQKFRDRYSTDEVPYLGSEAEVAYTAIYLYKEAVELAKTTDTEAVIRALESDAVSFDGPGGTVTVRGADHHVIRDTALFRVTESHAIELVERFPEMYSDFVENAMERHTGVNSLKKMGTHAPNLQYSLMYNKYINVL